MSNNSVISTYAAYAINDKLRMNSSSGAIFSILAEYILRKGGVVYGVTMSKDCKSGEFIRVTDKVNLSKLRGSKYLQAKVDRTYQKVKLDLESRKVVFFTGTGCQVNGLKLFLGKSYDNLLCVDFICHGVPSPGLWRKYVESIEKHNNAQLVNVNFRCKDRSWFDFGMKKIDSKHKAIYVSKDRDPYMLMFLRDYCLRPACYECVAKNYKSADLTLADFWGIDRVAPKLNDGKGISLVLVRTEKGKKLFKESGSDLVTKNVSYEDGVNGNRAEYSSTKRPVERDCFFNDMSNLNFQQLKAKYAVPTPIPFKNKVKKSIKKMMKFILKKIMRRSIKNDFNYGILFILVMKS